MRAEDHFAMPSDPHLNRLGHHAVASWILLHMNRIGLTRAEPPAPELRRVDLAAWEHLGPIGLNGFEDDWRRTASRGLVALGPEAVLAFPASGGEQLELELRLTSLVPASSLQVLVNGREAAAFPTLGLGARREAVLSAPAVMGRNEVRLVFGNWRGRGTPGSRLRGSPAARLERLILGPAASTALPPEPPGESSPPREPALPLRPG